MKKLLLFFYILPFFAFGQFYQKDHPFAHTFSIVARDPETGEMGVAVQSHWFSVGTSVTWAKSGVGVVATQSFTNVSFGPRGLALMEGGMSAQEALEKLIKEDDGRDYRQVALLKTDGTVASYTGKSCIESADNYVGDNFSVQANMMLNDKVVPAMKAAYLAHRDLPLAERMVEVLKAAQAAGGDIRGRQSAALLVVGPDKVGDEVWKDKKIDLRVDDAEEPIQELDRLLKLKRAYDHMNSGDLAVEHEDMQKANAEYGVAQKMFPNNLEMQYWQAITLANNGDVKKAAEMLKPIYAKDDHWRPLTKRLVPSGLLNVTDEQLKLLMEK